MATLTDAHLVLDTGLSHAGVIAAVHVSLTRLESYLAEHGGLQFRLRCRLRTAAGPFGEDATVHTLPPRLITRGGTVTFEGAVIRGLLSPLATSRAALYARFDLESLEAILPLGDRADSEPVRLPAG